MAHIYTNKEFEELIDSGKIQQALTSDTGYIIAVAGERQYLIDHTANGIELTRIKAVKLECMLASSFDTDKYHA